MLIGGGVLVLASTMCSWSDGTPMKVTYFCEISSHFSATFAHIVTFIGTKWSGSAARIPSLLLAVIQ